MCPTIQSLQAKRQSRSNPPIQPQEATLNRAIRSWEMMKPSILVRTKRQIVPPSEEGATIEVPRLNFRQETKIAIAIILQVPLTAAAQETYSKRIAEVEVIEGGSYVEPITDLVDRYQKLRKALVAPLDATTGEIDLSAVDDRRLIQADVLKWSDKRDVGADLNNQLKALRSEIAEIFALPWGRSRGTSLIRSDNYGWAGRSSLGGDARLIAW